MSENTKLLITFLILLTALNVPAQTIVWPRDALPNGKLAAKEVRWYVYLRTGKLLPVAETKGRSLEEIERIW